MKELSQSQLQDLFAYDSITGALTYKVSPAKKIKIGDQVNSINGCGFLQVCINKKYYLVDRIIWFHQKGYVPTTLTHINKNKLDNRISNLKEIKRSTNNVNRSLNSNNSSGHRGISWHKQTNKWRVVISINKKKIYLGGFLDINDAITAREKAEEFYHSYDIF